MPDTASVNAYLLQKQHLLPESRVNDAASAVKDLIATDADSLMDAYYSIAIRVKGYNMPSFIKELNSGKDYARVRGLKNSMQMVDVSAMPLVYSVSRSAREAKAKQALLKWGISEDEYAKVSDAIAKALGDKEKTLSQLKSSIPAGISRDIVMPRNKKERATNVAVVATVMNDRWALLRGGVGRTPVEDPGRFSLFSRRFKGIKLEMDRDIALMALIEKYVERYGPVSAMDIAWWCGIEKEEALAYLERSSTIRIVNADGHKVSFYISGRDEREMEAQKPVPSILLLPSDDPYTKAYKSFKRFVAPGFEDRLMMRFGGTLRAVVIDGMVKGEWEILTGEEPECRISMFEKQADTKALKALAAHAIKHYTGMSGPANVKISYETVPLKDKRK